MYDGLIIKWTQGTGYSGKLDRKVTDKIKCFADVDEEIVPSVYDNKAVVSDIGSHELESFDGKMIKLEEGIEKVEKVKLYMC
ncbi:hypothetical protein AgCh_020121 [Apium graveolens]